MSPANAIRYRSLRLDPKLDERLKAQAKANHRNAHQQVILWIEEGLEREKGKKAA